jgi:hypothetical protein
MSTEQPDPNDRNTVFDELALLGRNIGDTVRSVIDSPQAREIEEEVRTGFQTVISEVNDAIGKARSSDVAHDLGDRTSQATESVRASKVTDEVRTGLVKGLHSLNKELEQLLQRLDTPTATDAPAASPAPETPAPEPATPESKTAE